MLGFAKRLERDEYAPFPDVSSYLVCAAPVDDDEQDQLDMCNTEPLLTESLKTMQCKTTKEICQQL